MTLKELLAIKNKRIKSIPDEFQKALEGLQPSILSDINSLLSRLDLDGDTIKINAGNLRLIAQISDDLKGIVVSDKYISAVKQFTQEFSAQAKLNTKLFELAFEGAVIPELANAYIDTAKRNAIASLVGAPIDTEFIKPVQSLLETSVTAGASYKDTLSNLRQFVEGGEGKDAKLLKYAKQITNDSFAIADRSYTNIVAEALDAEWYYYSGGEFDTTRCFCKERVDRFFHYKEIQSWGRGENLGDCNVGGGMWAGEIAGTDENTIFNYAGGWNCQHSFMIVSEFAVPKSDIKRAKLLGYV